jgi:hypothetical protein
MLRCFLGGLRGGKLEVRWGRCGNGDGLDYVVGNLGSRWLGFWGVRHVPYSCVAMLPGYPCVGISPCIKTVLFSLNPVSAGPDHALPVLMSGA